MEERLCILAHEHTRPSVIACVISLSVFICGVSDMRTVWALRQDLRMGFGKMLHSHWTRGRFGGILFPVSSGLVAVYSLIWVKGKLRLGHGVAGKCVLIWLLLLSAVYEVASFSFELNTSEETFKRYLEEPTILFIIYQRSLLRSHDSFYACT